METNSSRRGKAALALIVAGIMLAASGMVSLAASLAGPEAEASPIVPNVINETYQVRRWNPPTYPGVGGPQIMIAHTGDDYSICSMGFFVYNVTSRTWYYNPYSHEGDAVQPMFTVYTTRVWLVSAGHCGNEEDFVYQPDWYDYNQGIGKVEYSSLYQSLTYLVDALLVKVDKRTAYNTVPKPVNVTNKILVLKFTDTSTCEWEVFNATSVDIDHGNFTADSFFTSKWPIYHAGRTQGYTVTDVWDENGNRVYNSMLSPTIVQFAWYDFDAGTWVKTLAFMVNKSAIVPCTGEEVEFADAGDSGSPAFAYIGFGNDLTNPREHMVLGIVVAKYWYTKAVYVAPASKIIYRYNLVDDLDLKFYNGTVVP